MRQFRFVLSLCLSLSAVAPALAQRSADEELKSLVVPDDLEIGLYASEPMITNPAAIDVDTHGRVWVAEIQWYRKAAKSPPADQIKVLEDTDGDGRADKATVFADNVFAPMSICVAGSKVYVATSPDLWVYEDANGDLKADGPPTKLLTGFGGFNHDHGAHSLVLGPDHKWWMSHGDAGYNVTGKDGSKIEFPAGGMIRGELDGTKLENVATNFRNPYEICVNSFGEAFCSDNDNDGNFSVRICWILEGGNYGWYKRPGPKFPPGTPYGETWHFRGAIPGFVPSTLVTGFGSPCGMCYYEGDAIPSLKNMPLHCDAGPREVRAYPHQKAGAGFKATQKNIVTSKDDAYFRPDDICAMPDGSLLVADWYDGGVGGHAYNNPNQGRIFRLTPKGKKPERVGKPGPYASIDDAIVGLKNPNLATQFLAREKLLAEGQAAVPALVELMKSADKNYGARAAWLLDRIGGAAREEVVKLLNAEDPDFQALAVRILRRHTDDDSIGKRLLTMSSTTAEVWRELVLYWSDQKLGESNTALVRLAAQIPENDRYARETMMIAAKDRKEAILAGLLNYGGLRVGAIQLAPFLSENDGEFVFYFVHGMNSRNAIESLDQIGVILNSEAFDAAAWKACDEKAAKPERRRAIEWLTFNCSPTGLWSGIVGQADASVSAWTDYKPPKDFDGRKKLADCVKQLLGEPEYQGDALKLAAAANVTEVGPEIVAIITSADTSAAVRDQAIQVAVAIRSPGAAEALAKLLLSDDAKQRATAVAALVDMQDWKRVQPLLAAGAPQPQVRAVVDRMMGSTGGALVLLKWLDAKLLDSEAQKIAVGRAANHPDANVRALFEKYIPEADRPQRLGATIKAADILALTGDAARGEQIFNQSSAAQCKNCHIVRGFGRDLGPDLTQIGKKYERAVLLETILEPSKAISHGYETYIAETEEGQIVAGFLVEQNNRFVVLRTGDGKQVRLPTASVESLTKSEKSIMPELVLRDVTAQDAADLLAYLMTLKEPLTQK